MKRIALWGAGIAGAIALAAIAAFQLSPALQDQLFAYGARQQMARASQLPTGDDALRVLLCGTSIHNRPTRIQG